MSWAFCNLHTLKKKRKKKKEGKTFTEKQLCKSNPKLNKIWSGQYHLYSISNKEKKKICEHKCLLQHKTYHSVQWNSASNPDPSFNKLLKSKTRIFLKAKKWFFYEKHPLYNYKKKIPQKKRKKWLGKKQKNASNKKLHMKKLNK